MKSSTNFRTRVGSHPTEESAFGKGKIAIAIVAILLVGGAVWAFLGNRPDAEVEKVKQLQAEAFKPDATPEQRRENFQLVRQEMEKLSPEQRDQVREQMHEGFERRMDEQIRTYFALPAEQKTAYLDKQIQEMEQRRKEWEVRRAQGGQGGAGGQQSGAGGQQGGPGGQQAGGGPPRPPRDQSADARAVRRDQRLDRSTAEQRAQRSAYFADLQQRRVQLGLPASPFHGGRGPGR